MDFHAPTSIAEAIGLLGAEDARCLAGGQSLLAMMNLELAAPSRLVSLRNIAALRGIEQRGDGGLRIGAMTTHAEIAALESTAAGPRLLALAARVLGYPAIRNQGTLGGSVANADPAADYPVALIAANAEIEIASGGKNSRRVPAAEFFRGMFETALAPAEIVIAVHLPPGPAAGGAHYEKFSLVAGDFAIASVAAIIAMKNGKCSAAGIAAGACATKPVRSAAVEAALVGSALDNAALARAGELLVQACAPHDDNRASGAYRRRILPTLLRRAVLGARASITGDAR